MAKALQSAKVLVNWGSFNEKNHKAKKTEREDPLGFFNIHSVAKLRIFFFFPLSDIMDARHQSSAMCIIKLGGEDTHTWSATNVGNPTLATIPVDQ